MNRIKDLFTKMSVLQKYTIVIFLLACIESFVWNVVYHFDSTPLAVIDGIIIINMVISSLTVKKVPLTGSLLIAMNATLVFLGFILIRGLLGAR